MFLQTLWTVSQVVVSRTLVTVADFSTVISTACFVVFDVKRLRETTFFTGRNGFSNFTVRHAWSSRAACDNVVAVVEVEVVVVVVVVVVSVVEGAVVDLLAAVVGFNELLLLSSFSASLLHPVRKLATVAAAILRQIRIAKSSDLYENCLLCRNFL